jgi:hypothetical protein
LEKATGARLILERKASPAIRLKLCWDRSVTTLTLMFQTDPCTFAGESLRLMRSSHAHRQSQNLQAASAHSAITITVTITIITTAMMITIIKMIIMITITIVFITFSTSFVIIFSKENRSI